MGKARTAGGAKKYAPAGSRGNGEREKRGPVRFGCLAGPGANNYALLGSAGSCVSCACVRLKAELLRLTKRALQLKYWLAALPCRLTVEHDLFGNPILKRKRDPLAKHRKALQRYDEESREERARRQRVLEELHLGRELHYLGDLEGASLLYESGRTYVDGHFAAAIVLAQAIIETALQNWLVGLGHRKFARSSLKVTLDFLEHHSTFPPILLRGFESLRQKRNIYTHIRPPDDNARLWKRMMEARDFDTAAIHERDAEDAVRLVFALIHLDLKLIQVRP